jgi:hypothetical protein
MTGPRTATEVTRTIESGELLRAYMQLQMFSGKTKVSFGSLK